MPRQSPAPTLKDIAERSGYGRSTVSLALRNHPSLPEETRKTIQKVATELGYRPNPLVSALMTQIRDKRRKQRERIALISRFSTPASQVGGTYYRRLFEAIEKEAKEHGYDLEEFCTDTEKPLSGERLTNILQTRNIHGIILFPGGRNKTCPVDYPKLEWDKFATVLVGFNSELTNVHQIASHYAYDMELALHYATSLGKEAKVGLALSASHDTLTDFGWTSRFLLYQSRIPEHLRIPMVDPEQGRLTPDTLLSWFTTHRPKVIITAEIALLEWMEDAGYNIPKDVRIINLVQRGEFRYAGIDPYTDEVGRAAVELLISLLQTNQRGLPDFPRTISIKGKWSPGETFPES